MAKPVHLDGRTLEGGGQLLRLALSLSSLTGTAIHVTDIRGNRGKKSGNAGGIKAAHLAGGLWLAGVTNAATEGLEIKSSNLVFCPKKDCIPSEAVTLWKEIYKPDKYGQGIVQISIDTPGSVFLILQSILPYLLFAGSANSASSASTVNQPDRIKVILEGGTNVWHSLSYEYADQVLFPMLNKKIGFGTIDMKLHKRGWSAGRTSIGKIEIDLTPLPAGEILKAFDYTNRGGISKFYVSILGHDQQIRNNVYKLTVEKLSWLFPETDIELAVDEVTSHPSRLYLLVVAESENGYRLGRDWLYDQKINQDKPMKTVETLVTKVVRDMQEELAHGACVDEWLQDQIVVFQSLADGKSMIDSRKPSLHTQTARWVAEQILGVKFNAGGDCKGIGLRAVAR